MEKHKLTRTAFEQARSFLQQRGRPIDLALYAYHFEDGGREKVLTALAEYQNQDGGFGHALEPDLRLGDSSSIATSVAFQILRQVGAGTDDALVCKGVEFLVKSYDAQAGVWPIIPQQADTEPRAPWWDYAKSAEALGGFRLNPRAELVGYLLEYASLVDKGLLETLLANTMDHVDSTVDDMDMGDFMCCYRLAETESFEHSAKLRLWDKLQRAAGLIVERDQTKWSGYATRPLWLAPVPGTPVAAVLRPEIAVNLDYDVKHQNPDGSWSPFWSWSGAFDRHWITAKAEWESKLTLDSMLTMRSYGRIEDE